MQNNNQQGPGSGQKPVPNNSVGDNADGETKVLLDHYKELVQTLQIAAQQAKTDYDKAQQDVSSLQLQLRSKDEEITKLRAGFKRDIDLLNEDHKKELDRTSAELDAANKRLTAQDQSIENYIHREVANTGWESEKKRLEVKIQDLEERVTQGQEEKLKAEATHRQYELDMIDLKNNVEFYRNLAETGSGAAKHSISVAEQIQARANASSIKNGSDSPPNSNAIKSSPIKIQIEKGDEESLARVILERNAYEDENKRLVEANCDLRKQVKNLETEQQQLHLAMASNPGERGSKRGSTSNSYAPAGLPSRSPNKQNVNEQKNDGQTVEQTNINSNQIQKQILPQDQHQRSNFNNFDGTVLQPVAVSDREQQLNQSPPIDSKYARSNMNNQMNRSPAPESSIYDQINNKDTSVPGPGYQGLAETLQSGPMRNNLVHSPVKETSTSNTGPNLNTVPIGIPITNLNTEQYQQDHQSNSDVTLPFPNFLPGAQGEFPAKARKEIADITKQKLIADERVKELEFEIKQCREAKHQLERELVKNPAGTMQIQLDEAIRDKNRSDQRYKREMEAMNEKLKWYAESQVKMDEDREKVQDLTEQNEVLRSRCREMKVQVDAFQGTGKRSSMIREKELQKRNQELADLLKKKAPPNSILSMLSVVEKENQDSKEKAELQNLKEDKEKLQKQLDENTVFHDRQLRALRAQYDALRYNSDTQKFRDFMGLHDGGVNGGTSSTVYAGEINMSNNLNQNSNLQDRNASSSSSSSINNNNYNSNYSKKNRTVSNLTGLDRFKDNAQKFTAIESSPEDSNNTAGGGPSGPINSGGNSNSNDMQSSVLQNRIKTLERELENTKTYYMKKLRSKDPLVPESIGPIKYSSTGRVTSKNSTNSNSNQQQNSKSDSNTGDRSGRNGLNDNVPRDNSQTRPGSASARNSNSDLKKIQSLESRIEEKQSLINQLQAANNSLSREVESLARYTGNNGNRNSSGPGSGSGPSGTQQHRSTWSPIRNTGERVQMVNRGPVPSHNPHANSSSAGATFFSLQNQDEELVDAEESARMLQVTNGITMSASMLRKFLSHPFAHMIQVLEMACQRELKTRDTREIQFLLQYINSVRQTVELRQKSVYSGVLVGREFLDRVQRAVEVFDHRALRSLLDQSLSERLCAYGKPQFASEQSSLMLDLWADRWRDDMHGDLGLLVQDLRVHALNTVNYDGLGDVVSFRKGATTVNKDIDKNNDILAVAQSREVLLWREMEESLRRCGPGGPELDSVCRDTSFAARPEFQFYLGDMERLLGSGERATAIFGDALQTVRKIRHRCGGNSDHRPPISQMLCERDVSQRGFLTRPVFIEALGRLKNISLTQEEKNAVSVMYSNNPESQVEYLLFLREILPNQYHFSIKEEANLNNLNLNNNNNSANLNNESFKVRADELEEVSFDDIDKFANSNNHDTLNGNYGAKSNTLKNSLNQNINNNTTINVAKEQRYLLDRQALDQTISELRNKNEKLSELNTELQSRLARGTSGSLSAIHADVSVLETTLLQTMKKAENEWRKKEITLCTELQVKDHEIASLKQVMNSQEQMLLQTTKQLENTRSEMRFLMA